MENIFLHFDTFFTFLHLRLEVFAFNIHKLLIRLHIYLFLSLRYKVCDFSQIRSHQTLSMEVFDGADK